MAILQDQKLVVDGAQQVEIYIQEGDICSITSTSIKNGILQRILQFQW